MLGLCLALTPLFLFAQTTTGLNYQAVLRKSNYEAIGNQSGTALVSIIHNNTELYREIHIINTDRLGLFNLVIGKGNSVRGNFATLDWGSEGRMVKVTVSVGGDTYDFAPTELQAVPYAKVAERSLQPGPAGPKGDKGDTGATGAQGPKGDKGDKGDVGATGTQGPKGDKGDKGDAGATGAQGPKGDKGDKGDAGATGAQGPKGDKGDKGDAGATGAQGPKGDNGDKGDAGTTGAQGPKGDKGDKGDAGTTGAQGPKGDKGDKGDAGATGAQGPKGDKGDKGDAGTTGAQGPKGDKGDKGDAGATGAQGPKGDKGDNGDVGTTGAQGPKGDKGDPGDSYWMEIGPNIFNTNTGSILIGHSAVSPLAYSKLDVNGTAAFHASVTGVNPVLRADNTSDDFGTALLGTSPKGIGGAFYGGLRGLYAEVTTPEGIAAIQANGRSRPGLWGQTETAQGVFGQAYTTGTAGHFVANAGIGGFFTSTSGAALITDQGNVGIGTSTPGQKLSVNGSMGVKGSITIAANASNDASTIAQNGKDFNITNPQLGNIILRSENGPSFISIGNNRQTGINTLNPAGTFHITQNCCSQTSLLLTGGNIGETYNDGARITIENNNNESIMKIVNSEYGVMQLINGANGGVQLFGASFIPMVDNSTDLGRSNARWRTIWSAIGTIQTSDARLKKNIQNLNYGLSTVLKMRPVSYQWKADSPSKVSNLGFIAQEMVQVVPEVVINEEDTYGIKYADLIPVLTKAIQEQQTEIEALKKENEELRSKTTQVLSQQELLGQKIAKLEALALSGKVN